MVPYECLFRPLTQSSAFTCHRYTPGETGRQEIMDLRRQRGAAGSRLLMTYLVVSLVPVLALMLAMPAALRMEARSRGLAEARAQAALLAQASVEPLLGVTPLRGAISAAQRTALTRLDAQAVQERHIL